MANTNQSVDELYNQAATASKRYKVQIENYPDDGNQQQVKKRGELHQRDLKNLDDLLGNAAKEIGIPLKSQDNSNDHAVSSKDMKAIYAYTDKRSAEYEKNRINLKANQQFHKDTIETVSNMTQEARKHAAEITEQGKAGQTWVKNAPPATSQQNGNGTAANQNESVMARALPKEENKKTAANINLDKDSEERKGFINALAAKLGLSSGQRDHLSADPSVAGKGDKLPSADAVVASAQRVTGDIGNMKREVLDEVTNIGNKMKMDGFSMEKGTRQDAQMQAMSVAKVQTTEIANHHSA